MSGSDAAIWLISALSIALVLIRPRGIAEAWWAGAGALLLVLTRLIDPASAWHAIAKGFDVYLFLIGMMIMSELARREGVFDWVAVHAVKAAKGSRSRLFLLIYLVGTVVTIFLSNDATAVVLTPAVFAAVQAAEAEALPYLFICAFIANAASFVLPISNPANLVVFSDGMPPLKTWLITFGLPSIASIVLTFLVLRWLARNHLNNGALKQGIEEKPISPSGKIALSGIGFLGAVLMTASAFNLDLGAPAFASGLMVAVVIAIRDHRAIQDIARKISWAVVPLVAGLFVIVEALNQAGALPPWPRDEAKNQRWLAPSEWPLLSNLMNNLPSGLIAGAAVKAAHSTSLIRSSVLTELTSDLTYP